MSRKFPFTIRQVAKIMELTIRYDNPDNGNIDCDCPFCKAESKLNLNAAKNVYRCNSCNENGGMTQLYGKAYGISNIDAYREIYEIVGCSIEAPNGVNNSHVSKPASRANANVIHQTYSMLLSLLTLATPHRDQLLYKGMSNEQIDAFMYKSVPAFGQKKLCMKLIQSGCTLEGVPGFYRDGGEWNIRPKAPGILIPICGIDGKISGIQIRLDKPINGRDYIWFSSKGLEGGTSSGAPIHFIGDPAAKRIYVTDGAMKGTVAHALTGNTFVCLPGTKSLNRLDELLSHLKANDVIEALEAFDMTKLTDEQAGEPAAKLRQLLSTCGYKVSSAVWRDKSISSVDEYFLNRIKKERGHVHSVAISSAA